MTTPRSLYSKCCIYLIRNNRLNPSGCAGFGLEQNTITVCGFHPPYKEGDQRSRVTLTNFY